MSDEIIKNLKELSTKHEIQLSEIRKKLRIIEMIPKAKALEGKCFKYKDNYTYGGKRPCWFYKRVIAVLGENVVVDTFQSNRQDKLEIRFNEIEYASRFDSPTFIKISLKEYFKQFDILLKSAKKRGFYGK